MKKSDRNCYIQVIRFSSSSPQLLFLLQKICPDFTCRFWSKYPKSVNQMATDPTPISKCEESEQLSKLGQNGKGVHSSSFLITNLLKMTFNLACSLLLEFPSSCFPILSLFISKKQFLLSFFQFASFVIWVGRCFVNRVFSL